MPKSTVPTLFFGIPGSSGMAIMLGGFVTLGLQVQQITDGFALAEEELVYPKLARKDAITEHESEHGEEEHAEGHEAMLKVLDVDGAVRRVKGGWESTGREWTYDAERYARVAEAREREHETGPARDVERRAPPVDRFGAQEVGLDRLGEVDIAVVDVRELPRRCNQSDRGEVQQREHPDQRQRRHQQQPRHRPQVGSLP